MVISVLRHKYHNCINKQNNNKNNSKQRHKCSSALAFAAIWLVFCLGAAAVDSAAVYSNVDFLTNPIFEPICSAQQEHFIESEGKESSLILEFNRAASADKKKSCTRILSAPSNYGFIVRLILPKLRRGRQHAPTATPTLTPTPIATATATELSASDKPKTKSAVTTLNEMTSTLIEKLNSTALGRTCPMSIFSSLDPHTPQWRIDPCLLEDTAPEMEDPVRLFHGRVRIVWENRYNKLNSKLMVTVLGKGEQCRGEHKHPCLKIGDEPILCIAKELVCDGIRHCPTSNEYNSDENYQMCWKRRRFGEPIPPAMESDIFEHFALEVFRNLFASDTPSGGDVSAEDAITTVVQSAVTTPPPPAAQNSTTLRKVDGKQVNATVGGSSGTSGNTSDTSTPMPQLGNSTSSRHPGRNSTRFGLNSDLSKYGPWGYLMLGMLLCGGALLICGLWASASQHAANNERESALQNTAHGIGNGEHPTGNVSPPNYDELDPPPAYSMLFPNQKAASSATLSSLAAAVAPPAFVATATANPANGTPERGVDTATNSATTATVTVTAVTIDDATASGSQATSN